VIIEIPYQNPFVGSSFSEEDGSVCIEYTMALISVENVSIYYRVSNCFVNHLYIGEMSIGGLESNSSVYVNVASGRVRVTFIDLDGNTVVSERSIPIKDKYTVTVKHVGDYELEHVFTYQVEEYTPAQSFFNPFELILYLIILLHIYLMLKLVRDSLKEAFRKR
ncbi:MAG: hypothetical protein QXO80_05965, partial [Thermosphaera sp.]